MAASFVLSRDSRCDVPHREGVVIATRGGRVRKVRLTRVAPCGLAEQTF